MLYMLLDSFYQSPNLVLAFQLIFPLDEDYPAGPGIIEHLPE